MINPNVSWAERYRPKNVDDLIFPNKKWTKVVDDWMTSGKIGGNIALFGPGGLGKSSLSKILVNSIIKNPADFKLIKTRSVQEIDTIGEFIRSQPMASPTKIILIEEADRLSSAAQNELKDKYSEQYQDHCSIIITSNFPYQIDKFLLQRFLYKIDFGTLDNAEVFRRLLYIINNENCKVNESDLKNWIENNVTRGMRSMINDLQISAKMNDNIIVFDDIIEKRDLETKIIILCQKILSNFMECTDVVKRKLAYVNPIPSEIIGTQWVELVHVVTNNYGISYKIIFEELEKSIHFIPLKNILAQYIETIETKKYPHIHILACVGEMLKCISEVTS